MPHSSHGSHKSCANVVAGAGRPTFNKSVYLLQTICDVPFGFEFILYKHGPFSFDLRDELTSLRADSLLSLESQPIPYGPRFAPTSRAADLIERFPKTLERFGDAINFIADRVGDRGVNALERLATAVYVTHQQPDATVSQRADALVELKPHVSPEDASVAVGEADELFADPMTQEVH